MNEIQDTRWNDCIKFHGHACGGLVIGYQAANYAQKLLDLGHSQDEEVVCVAECDACSIDAIQVMLGCTVGKGNLLFHITGKFAFSFYNRKTQKSVRLVLDTHDEGLTHEESFQLYLKTPMEKMFQVTETKLALPEHARLYRSLPCCQCGEWVAENHLHLWQGKYLCSDCSEKYDRFSV